MKYSDEFSIKTRIYQSNAWFKGERLKLDGIWGPKTQTVYDKHGEIDTGITIPRAHTFNDVSLIYGDIKYREAGGGQVVVTNNFERLNMILMNLPGYGKLYVNMAIMSSLEDAFNSILESSRSQFGIKTVQCFNPRHKLHRTYGDLSVHSWGAAIDINPHENAYGTFGSIDPNIVYILRLNGFEWGGLWSNLDPMHFQKLTGY